MDEEKQVINTQLHPDGDDSIILHPETSPEQIVGLEEYLHNTPGLIITIVSVSIEEVNSDG